MSITQIIHPQSNARFSPHRSQQPYILCTGDTANVPVTLTGSGPWKLDYEIMFGNSKTRYSVDRIDDGTGFSITTPSLTRGGHYVIGLTGKALETSDEWGLGWNLWRPCSVSSC